MVYKLLNICTLGKYGKSANKDPEHHTNIITDPAQAMKDNINNLKRYKEELTIRSNKCQELEELQQQVKLYKDRIETNPKEYNKSSYDKNLQAQLKEKMQSKISSSQRTR
ncbi:hypothetical protein [Candidatus Tisiphia endosymbiont of Beris chalybata]|uniref:hypothetical protein n=1 Tax=Candidatus Tisiphia endosymbiont of Beris chalybata TaxID=3066262 RepID=UPI00312C9C66